MNKTKAIAIRNLNKIIRRFDDDKISIESIEIGNDMEEFPNLYGIIRHIPTGWHTLTIRWIEPINGKRKKCHT